MAGGHRQRGVAQHGIAERAAEPCEDGGLQHKGGQRRRHALEHLVGEVVGDKAMRAAKGRQHARAAVWLAQGQCGQLQAANPAVGAGFQLAHLLGG